MTSELDKLYIIRDLALRKVIPLSVEMTKELYVLIAQLEWEASTPSIRELLMGDGGI